MKQYVDEEKFLKIISKQQCLLHNSFNAYGYGVFKEELKKALEESRVRPHRHIKRGAWSEDEINLLIRRYETEKKPLAVIAEELERSQDAVRTRLWELRRANKLNGFVSAKKTKEENL